MPTWHAFLCVFLQLTLSTSAFAQAFAHEGSQGMALRLPSALTAHEQSNLGNMYLNGQGVAKSDWEAAAWYRKSTDQGTRERSICSRLHVPEWSRCLSRHCASCRLVS